MEQCDKSESRNVNRMYLFCWSDYGRAVMCFDIDYCDEVGGGKRTSWMDQEETISDKRKRQLTEAQLDSYKSSYPNQCT